jgi:hypothetical protein
MPPRSALLLTGVALTAGASTAAPASALPPGHAAGYHLTQYRGTMLYSLRVGRERFRLVARRGSGDAHGVGVAVQDVPFLVDLGTDAAGRLAAVYPRRRRLVVLDLATSAERVVARTPAPVGAVAIHHGRVTYATTARRGHRSTILSVAADGTGRPRAIRAVHGVVTALDTSRHGLAYVAVWPEPGAAHSQNRLVFRGRNVARTAYGEEGGADIVALSFAGADLVWGISGEDSSVTSFGTVERVDLRDGHRRTLPVPGGGLVDATPDAARPGGPALIAFERDGGEPGFSPDPDEATLRRFPARAFTRR